MNAIVRTSAALLAVVIGVTTLNAAEKDLRVEASRELRLAVVDSTRNAKAREALQTAFAASLSEAVSQACGSEVKVKAKPVGADNAAFNLNTGVYDAVLVLAPSLPRQLMISQVSRLSATLGAGKHTRKAFLIFNQGDEGLAKLLASSFEIALTNEKFMDAMDGGLIDEAEAGQKVAAN